MKPPQVLLFSLVAFALAACGPATESAVESLPAVALGQPEPQAEAISSSPRSAQPIVASEEAPPAAAEGMASDALGVQVGFTEDGHAYMGASDAPIVMEEFSDFQCPYCERFVRETLPDLYSDEIASGQVRIIFYDFPLDELHPQATAAAIAARCAAEEGALAFWRMHDLLFEQVDAWSVTDSSPVFTRFAQQLGLDQASFELCLEQDRFGADIDQDLTLGWSRGVSGTPSFFLNGQPLVGAQSLAVFREALADVGRGEQIAGAEQPAAPDAGAPPAAGPTPAAVADAKAAAMLGDASAPITVVEFTDYQCPYCLRHTEETLPRLLTDMIETGRVRYVVMDFPLDNIHPEARAAAGAARCAGEQDAYWGMHDLLFAGQTRWSGLGAGAATVFAELAGDLGLDASQFEQCLQADRYGSDVQANVDEGLALGVQGTPGFFISGYPLFGAQPFEVFDYAIGLAESGTLAQAYVPRPEPTAAPPALVEVPIGNAYSIGESAAAIVIVEYTDYQCPYCGRHFAQTYPRLMQEYVEAGQVLYVFKDFPLSEIHPQALKAAEAARCAGDQGAYVPMHDILFQNQTLWSGQATAEESFVAYAAEIGLDEKHFADCLASGRHEEAILADQQEGLSLGVRGTPAFFVNGQFVGGAQPFEIFQQVIAAHQAN